MISLLGRTAILVALAACAVGSVTGILAGYRKSADGWRWARWMAYVFGACVVLAAGLMEYALLADDFSVSYVTQVGSRSAPTWISVVSLWSALEGSILLWAVILGLYVAAFAWFTAGRFPDHTPYALGVSLAVGVFFCFLVAGIANPFALVDPAPSDGPGPNALLQNHLLMIAHPPMLYLGYVGMTVPFGMGAAALLAGRMDAAWTRALRQWTILPWGFLGFGIVLGGWWSYEVLGWGGAWAWDPVENASFLPWLTGTAFIHSAVLMERREQLKGWTLSLVMATFLLTLLGTFMTRSGVFNSVHSFTQSPIGPVFLGFLAVCLVFTVVLLAARIDALSPPDKGLAGPISRDASFLIQNLLFVAFTFTVLLGTTWPLINEALTDTRISVGEPYFNRMAVPIGLAILFMMGAGPALPWGRSTPSELFRRLSVPTAAGVVTAALCFALGLRGAALLATFGMGAYVLVVTLREMVAPALSRSKARGESLPAAFVAVSVRARRRFGGYVVHIGVIMVIVGLAASRGYRDQRELTVRVGESITVQDYTLTFLGVTEGTEPNRTWDGTRFAVSKGGRSVGEMVPKLNHYQTMGQPIPTPEVRSTPLEDLYLSLVQVDADGGSTTLQVIVEPLVWWMWVGGVVMALGTLVSAWPKRRRLEVAPAVPRGQSDPDSTASLGETAK